MEQDSDEGSGFFNKRADSKRMCNNWDQRTKPRTSNNWDCATTGNPKPLVDATPASGGLPTPKPYALSPEPKTPNERPTR
jgi:hypothetical protein